MGIGCFSLLHRQISGLLALSLTRLRSLDLFEEEQSVSAASLFAFVAFGLTFCKHLDKGLYTYERERENSGRYRDRLQEGATVRRREEKTNKREEWKAAQTSHRVTVPFKQSRWYIYTQCFLLLVIISQFRVRSQESNFLKSWSL